MIEGIKGVKDEQGNTIPFTFDARVWAEEFVWHVERYPRIPTDEATMVTWFANALMAGYDHKSRQIREKNQFLSSDRGSAMDPVPK